MALLDHEVDQLLQEISLPWKTKAPAKRHTRRETVKRGDRKFSTHYHHLGPGGRPRNVGVMSKEKLQHLAAHPDSTDELRRMTRAELRRRGHHVPRISEAQYIEAWTPRDASSAGRGRAALADRVQAGREARAHLAQAHAHRNAGRALQAEREMAHYRRKTKLARGLVEAGLDPFRHHKGLAAEHRVHASRAKAIGDHALHAVHMLKAAEHDRLARDVERMAHFGEGLLVAIGRPTYPDSPEWDAVDEDLAGELQVREDAEMNEARGRTIAEFQHGMMPLNRPARAGRWHPDEDVHPQHWSDAQLKKGWAHHSRLGSVHKRAAKHFEAMGREELSRQHGIRSRHHRRRAATIHVEYYARHGRGIETVTGVGGDLFNESRQRDLRRTLERAFED